MTRDALMRRLAPKRLHDVVAAAGTTVVFVADRILPVVVVMVFLGGDRRSLDAGKVMTGQYALSGCSHDYSSRRVGSSGKSSMAKALVRAPCRPRPSLAATDEL